jgi:hypothetical protein
MYLDLFVMFMIFFISGYFVPISAKSKSGFEFVKSKFKRIYLPWIVAVFTLIPAYKFIFLFSRGLPQEEWFSYFHFFERTGTDLSFYANNPAQNWLWFLPVLFLFQVVYLGLSKTKLLSINISLKTGVILTFVFGVIYSVIISSLGLKGWFDSALLHFQRERLLVYFMAFLLGTLCYKHKAFEGKNKNKKLYVIANIIMTVGLSIFTTVALNSFFNIIDPERNFYFVSEFADRILYYTSALLSQLSFLYVMVYSFRFSLNKTNPLMNELNKNSYSVYIIHTIVLGVIALPLMSLHIPTMIKFLILSVLTFIFSNMIVYSYRTIKQKQINIKTIATTVLVVLILGAAINGYTDPTTKQQNNTSENSLPQSSQSIHAAVIAGDLETIKQLIVSGANLKEKEPAGGSSPLISAAVFNQTEIALALITAGADVNFINNDGSTPLHTAAFFCRTEIVKSLLASGADTNIKNNAGSIAAESVTVPFEAVAGIYDYFAKIYEPLGLKLDMERIKNTRPEIAKMISNGN